MNHTQSFSCPATHYAEVVAATRNWLAGENFNCQQLQTEDGGILLQIAKAGNWRKFIGMSTALNVVFRQMGNSLTVDIGAGRWIDKAAVGTVSLFILWPLAVTAGIGAWQQMKMPERIYEHIAASVRSINGYGVLGSMASAS